MLDQPLMCKVPRSQMSHGWNIAQGYCSKVKLKRVTSSGSEDIIRYQIVKLQWDLLLKLWSTRYSKRMKHLHHQWNMQRGWWWRALDCLTQVRLAFFNAKAEFILGIVWECYGTTYVIWYVGSALENAPQFKFWSTVMDIELLMTCFVPCGKGTSSYMYKHMSNSAAGSMPWTTLTMHVGCWYTYVT